LTSTPAAFNVWAFFLALHSAAQWLNLAQYNHLPSANLFAPSSAEILCWPTLGSTGAGPEYLATDLARVTVVPFGIAGGLGEEAQPVPAPVHMPVVCASHFRI